MTETDMQPESLRVHFTVDTTVTGKLTTNPYSEILLDTCQNLIASRKHSIAVVVAHMACEVATERFLSDAFARRNLQYLEAPVLELLNGYNLANDRNRKLYSALSGDNIEQQSFWQKFKESAKLRNRIIHKSEIATEADAEKSLQAAREFIIHLAR